MAPMMPGIFEGFGGENWWGQGMAAKKYLQTLASLGGNMFFAFPPTDSCGNKKNAAGMAVG